MKSFKSLALVFAAAIITLGASAQAATTSPAKSTKPVAKNTAVKKASKTSATKSASKTGTKSATPVTK
jgi:hypothetical protein